jgi:hypothetical protein
MKDRDRKSRDVDIIIADNKKRTNTGFGLEPTCLADLFPEIAEANAISHYYTIQKYRADLEKECDNILG